MDDISLRPRSPKFLAPPVTRLQFHPVCNRVFQPTHVRLVNRGNFFFQGGYSLFSQGFRNSGISTRKLLHFLPFYHECNTFNQINQSRVQDKSEQIALLFFLLSLLPPIRNQRRFRSDDTFTLQSCEIRLVLWLTSP